MGLELKLISWAVGLACIAGGALWLVKRGESIAHAEAAEATVAQLKEDSAIYGKRVQNLSEIAHDATVQADASRAAATAANRALASERVQLDAYVRAHRRPLDPPAAGASAPTDDALDVLADLFSRSDETAGELAAALDASHIAGDACVRTYESLR